MPPAIAGALAVGTFTASVVQIASSVIISAITAAVAQSIRSSDRNIGDLGEDLGPQAESRNVNVISPVPNRKTCYGQTRHGGDVVRASLTGATNQFLHLVIAVAAHEAEILGYIVDDVWIYPDQLDADGNVTTGKYAGKLRLRFLSGTDDQEADPFLVAETEADETARGRGVAMIYARAEFDSDIFPERPQISAWMKGKRLLDPRTGATAWTPNAALVWRDAMTADQADGGLAAKPSEIDAPFAAAAANTCDEIVTTAELDQRFDSWSTTDDVLIGLASDSVLRFHVGDRVVLLPDGTLPAGLSAAADYYAIPVKPVENDVSNIELALAASLEDAYAGTRVDIGAGGSGDVVVRKLGEPRYTVDCVYDHGENRADFIDRITNAMAGHMPFVDGFRLLPGVYRDPVVSLTQDDVVSSVQIPTRRTRRDLFNAVRGTHRSQANSFVPQPYPSVVSTAYRLEDGAAQPTFLDLDLGCTDRPSMARRIAAIRLQRHRNQVAAIARFNLAAFPAKAGSTIELTLPQSGWTRKTFMVETRERVIEEDQNGMPVLSFQLELSAVDPRDYEVALAGDVVPPVRRNTSLAPAFDVGLPDRVKIESEAAGGGKSDVVVTWGAPIDASVNPKGRILVEYRRADIAQDWISAGMQRGSALFARIPALTDGDRHNIRIRTINTVPAPSQFTWTTDYEVGTRRGTIAAEDAGGLEGTSSVWDLGELEADVVDPIDLGAGI